MARSLIRLPQLQGESLPASSATAFKFAKEGGGANPDVMTFDTSANEVLFADTQTVKILGDLFVNGSRTIVNSEVMTVSDSTIVAALPDVKDASFDTGGSASATVTVTAGSHGLTGANQKFYAMTDNAAIPEGIYETASVVDANSFTITLGSPANLAALQGSISGRIQDTNSDFGGYLIPTESGLVGLQYRESDQDLQLRGKDVNVDLNFSVTGNSNLNGNVILGDAAADDITINGVIQGATAMIFDGATKDATNRISLAISDPSAAQTITLPDASGLVPVAVGKSATQAQGAEDFGLQLSSAGLLEIDINAVGETLSATGAAAVKLDAADEILISDAADGTTNHRIKKTTLAHIQSFLNAGGSAKESLKVPSQIVLGTGNGKNGQNAAIFDYSSMSQGLRDALAATSDESQREVFLNGVLMREVDGSGDGDFVEDIANEELEFEFGLEQDDFVVIIARG